MNRITYLPNGDRATENAYGTFVHRKNIRYGSRRVVKGKTVWRLIKSDLKCSPQKPLRGSVAGV